MIASLVDPAGAENVRRLDIPAGRLADALVELGLQAGISTGIADAALANRPVRAVHGRLSVSSALHRMLAGSGLDFVQIDARSIRVVQRPPRGDRKPAAVDVVVEPASDIVVTASKRSTAFADFPGTLSVLDGGLGGFGRSGRNDSQSIVAALPSLSSTHLGPGRNKLIIRGVADSSFTGPTQAIVGQYLGDVRLNYNAPDPDLNLYDMRQIEVLEGPQGTLYGAGSLGGIVRLVPNAPDDSRFEATAAAGVAFTHGGDHSEDYAAMANLPIVKGSVAARVVVYRSVDGGYIDDAQRGLSNVNETKTVGGRADIRVRPGDDWTIDIGATVQDINNDDSQYAERGLPHYARRSAIAQPFDNDYRLGQFVVAKSWGKVDLLSASGLVRHDVGELYDATVAGGTPRAFQQDSAITLFSNETRLSRRGRNGQGWLIGTSFIANAERLTRSFRQDGVTTRITGVRNAVTQAALYGEASIGVLPGVTFTGGTRVAFSRLVGELLDTGTRGEPSRTEVEVLPSVALSWRPVRRLTVFARYQEGYRPGGLSVSAGASGVASQRFEGDSIATYEGGARYGDSSRDRLFGSISLSYARWEHIQADLVDNAGLPFTANLGDGRILGLEATGGWRPIVGLKIEAGLFLNDSELVRPDAGFADARHAELPDVAEIGARLGVQHNMSIGARWTLTSDASVRYHGPSRLGVGQQLDIRQGDYAETRLNARLGDDRIGLSVDISNLLGEAGNRFALGNPFGVMNRRQLTPLAPRTVRLGVDARF